MKKRTLFKSLLIAAFSSMSILHADATILFEDNFDSAVYGNNQGLVTGTGKIESGYWSINDLAGGVWAPSSRSTTSSERSLSGPRSLALSIKGTGDQAQPIGMLSSDGVNSTPTTEALKISFAFNVTTTDTAFSTFVLRSSAGSNVCVLYFGENGKVQVDTSSGRQQFATIDADTWYYFQIILPASPSPGLEYTVRLMQSDNTTEVASYTGNTLAGLDYNYISMYSSAIAGQPFPSVTYIDNVLVETIPEPGNVALSALGAGGILLAARYKKLF